ncbi:MAG: hypothetical protein ABF301_05265 [Sulfurovum sp.]|jgi:hypothetical protein|nr:MAG: Uncharacterised protein [Arcobacter lacus]
MVMVDLQGFVKFLLQTSLDQIEYMGNCLKLDSLSQRIENYCNSANAIFLKIDPLSEGRDKLLIDII